MHWRQIITGVSPTAAIADTTPPTVSAVSPASNANVVAPWRSGVGDILGANEEFHPYDCDFKLQKTTNQAAVAGRLMSSEHRNLYSICKSCCEAPNITRRLPPPTGRCRQCIGGKPTPGIHYDCGDNTRPPYPSTTPSSGPRIALNASVSATFSEAMSNATNQFHFHSG